MLLIKTSGLTVKRDGFISRENIAMPKKFRPEAFRERLKFAAKLKGVTTPAQFADYMKVGRQTGHNWWSGGTSHPRAGDLFYMAEKLGVSARWLALGEEPMLRGIRGVSPDEQRALDLYKALPEAWREDWLSDGTRVLERLNIKPSAANPYPVKLK